MFANCSLKKIRLKNRNDFLKIKKKTYKKNIMN